MLQPTSVWLAAAIALALPQRTSADEPLFARPATALERIQAALVAALDEVPVESRGDLLLLWSVEGFQPQGDAGARLDRLNADVARDLASRAGWRAVTIRAAARAGGLAQLGVAERAAVGGWNVQAELRLIPHTGFVDVEMAVTTARRASWSDWVASDAISTTQRSLRIWIDAEAASVVQAQPTTGAFVAAAVELPFHHVAALLALPGEVDAPDRIALLTPAGIAVARAALVERQASVAIDHMIAWPPDDAPRPGVGRFAGELSVLGGRLLVATNRQANVCSAASPSAESMESTGADGCVAPIVPSRTACLAFAEGRDFHAPDEFASGDFYSRRASWFTDRAGAQRAWVLTVRTNGALNAYSSTAEASTFVPVRVHLEGMGPTFRTGAALALADTDLDGQPELLSSSADAMDGADRLTLMRLDESGRLQQLWMSVPLDGTVLVAGTADINGDARPELLAVEEPAEPGRNAKLWVISGVP